MAIVLIFCIPLSSPMPLLYLGRVKYGNHGNARVIAEYVEYRHARSQDYPRAAAAGG